MDGSARACCAGPIGPAQKWVALAAIVGGMAVGCGPVGPEGGSLIPEQVLGASPTPSVDAESNLEVEPNDDFDVAQPVFAGQAVELIGSMAPIGGAADLDMWDVGAVAAGDRLIGKVTPDRQGDFVAAVMDEAGALIAHVDATNATASGRTIDVTFRSATSRVYLAFGARNTATALNYVARFEIQRQRSAPRPVAQAIVLHFNGASEVRIANRGPFEVPAFDAARIGPTFAGRTADIIERIVANVREDFGDLDVTLLMDSVPAPADASHIYFGTYDAALLGLADNVDPFNANRTQSAIIYTDTFALFMSLRPSIDQIAQVLSNTTSHEIGHLLGLRHTAASHDLMDITASAGQMLLDQWFGTAAIHPGVMPVGLQNAPSLLEWALGGTAPTVSPAKALARQRTAMAIDPARDFYVPREYLFSCGCTTCAHPD